MSELAIGVIMTIIIGAALAIIVGWGKFVEWRERVKSNGPVVMSRASSPAPQHTASALETDVRQTPDKPMMAVPTPEQMLDIFKVMRAAGIKRETIGAVWRAAGLPLNNNVWSKAEPLPPEPLTVTPIAGRPTSAQFADDPELVYHPPPR